MKTPKLGPNNPLTCDENSRCLQPTIQRQRKGKVTEGKMHVRRSSRLAIIKDAYWRVIFMIPSCVCERRIAK